MFLFDSQIVQLVEHPAVNRKVVSSNLTLGAMGSGPKAHQPRAESPDLGANKTC